MSIRRNFLASATSCCLLAGAQTPAGAGVLIELSNPFNHGYMGVNELGSNRLSVVHSLLYPSIGSLIDTDYVHFQPYYGAPSNNLYVGAAWSLDNFVSYEVPNKNPFASAYRNLHLPTYTLGASTAYFDLLARGSSNAGSPGFSANGGTFSLTTPNVDTGIGSAAGSVSANGEMKLKVDIKRSGFGGTPVAEGALQATYTDKFTVNGAGPSAAATISFGARASAPRLDFSDGDFYNYAVGYQVAVFQRVMLPDGYDEDGNPSGTLRPGIREHWADTGFYWMDARLVRDAQTQLRPEKVRIESLGEPPPGVEGVDFTKEVIGEDLSFKYIREIAYDPNDPLGLLYDDPMMPFDKSSVSGKYVLNPVTGQFVAAPATSSCPPGSNWS